MRAAAERFARRWWAGELGASGRALSALAAPASWGWSFLQRVRGRLDARAPSRVDGLRVVSVGNLAVGGTGKTPFVRWVASELDARGVATCLLVGRAGADEAELHRRWNPRVAVLVDRDRLTSAARAHAGGCRVAVLDDGFHHTRLARDLDVVLVSADDPFPGAVLPRGPYREPPSALARAGVVVVTRRAASPERAAAVSEHVEREWPGRLAGVVALLPGTLSTLDGSQMCQLPGDALAVCGVARPDSFARAVRQAAAGDVELLAFADHHPYDAADARRIRRRARGRTIVTTEKDAVKLERWSETLGETVVLSDRFQWERGEAAMRARLHAAVGEAEAA